MAFAPVALVAERTTGDLAGVIRDSTGVAHAGYQVRARQVSRGAAIVAVGATETSGRFALTNLAPDDYIIEALTVEGKVVATSRLVRVTAGGAATAYLTAMAPPRWGGGIMTFLANPLVIVGIVATAIAVPVAIYASRHSDASPSR